MIEIETTAELEAHLEAGEALEGVVLQGLDLFKPPSRLAGAPYRGALYTVEELYRGFDPARPESYREEDPAVRD